VTSNKTLLSLIYEYYISSSVQKQRVQTILLHEEGIVFYSGKLQASQRVLSRDLRLLQKYDQLTRLTVSTPFNNIWTLNFKAQPINAFFLYRQPNVRRSVHLPTSSNCAQRFYLISARSAVVGSWEEPPNI